jgi:hypothetical protein
MFNMRFLVFPGADERASPRGDQEPIPRRLGLFSLPDDDSEM